ncbi:MAG: hypothetical protein CMJ81_01125 [Planctomycetaceae bacterium]|nr:hypothetical protein [Planctomycetaceae bacterium]MBP62629.1 hypothetical protein [Planctomycetaceae bacterium]
MVRKISRVHHFFTALNAIHPDLLPSWPDLLYICNRPVYNGLFQKGLECPVAMFRSPATFILILLWASSSRADTRLAPNFSGITTNVNNIQLYMPGGGRLMSSLQVGRIVVHSSNFGVSGVSYYGNSGRVDVLQRNADPRQSFGGYAPYRQFRSRALRPDKRPAWPRPASRRLGTGTQNRISPFGWPASH